MTLMWTWNFVLFILHSYDHPHASCIYISTHRYLWGTLFYSCPICPIMLLTYFSYLPLDIVLDTITHVSRRPYADSDANFLYE